MEEEYRREKLASKMLRRSFMAYLSLKGKLALILVANCHANYLEANICS